MLIAVPDRPHRGPRLAFRGWRTRRPFWGGLLLALGGAEILLTEKASLKVVLHIGMQGLAGYLLPTLMVLLGLLILFNPSQRLFYSITGILLSLGSWLTSNLGGFFIGLLLGATGSCLTFGWLPDQEPRVSRRKRRKQERAEAHALTSEGAGTV
ncbi:membrane protein [Streptomyces regensis]|nr:membrane protein [Streptomyces regensis]KOG68923.1 membrane protein [Streptomyces antibioticus]